MPGKVLDVVLSIDRSLPRVPLVRRPADYIGILQNAGYSQVRMSGLSKFGTKYLNGVKGDEFTVWADPDVQFLLDYYLHLENMIEESRSGIHQVYLADGCFEISAFIEPRSTRTRAGVYRNKPFEPPFADEVVVPTGAYLAIWRSLAAGLVDHNIPENAR